MAISWTENNRPAESLWSTIFKSRQFCDPLGEALDVIGFNEYIGWYEHTPEDADKTVWKIAYDKPLIVSEFGGDAKYGLHGDPDRRWTEEYQANLYQHQLLMLKGIGQLRGMSPWILMDFRSPRRPLPGIQDYFNRKGLISDQGEKKEAFYILQKAYQEGAICNPEWVARSQELQQFRSCRMGMFGVQRSAFGVQRSAFGVQRSAFISRRGSGHGGRCFPRRKAYGRHVQRPGSRERLPSKGPYWPVPSSGASEGRDRPRHRRNTGWKPMLPNTGWKPMLPL
jgi:hypothetical protein